MIDEDKLTLPSRRGMLTMVGSVGALAFATTGLATQSDPETRIERLFTIWKDACFRINNSGGGDDHDVPLWEQLNAAEDQIIRSPIYSTRVTVIRLWIALEAHTVELKALNAICREDFVAYDREAIDREWHATILMQALRGMISLATGVP